MAVPKITKPCPKCRSVTKSRSVEVYKEDKKNINIYQFRCGLCKTVWETRIITRMDDVFQMLSELRSEVENFHLK